MFGDAEVFDTSPHVPWTKSLFLSLFLLLLLIPLTYFLLLIPLPAAAVLPFLGQADEVQDYVKALEVAQEDMADHLAAATAAVPDLLEDDTETREEVLESIKRSSISIGHRLTELNHLIGHSGDTERDAYIRLLADPSRLNRDRLLMQEEITLDNMGEYSDALLREVDRRDLMKDLQLGIEQKFQARMGTPTQDEEKSIPAEPTTANNNLSASKAPAQAESVDLTSECEDTQVEATQNDSTADVLEETEIEATPPPKAAPHTPKNPLGQTGDCPNTPEEVLEETEIEASPATEVAAQVAAEQPLKTKTKPAKATRTPRAKAKAKAKAKATSKGSRKEAKAGTKDKVQKGKGKATAKAQAKKASAKETEDDEETIALKKKAHSAPWPLYSNVSFKCLFQC